MRERKQAVMQPAPTDCGAWMCCWRRCSWTLQVSVRQRQWQEARKGSRHALAGGGGVGPPLPPASSPLPCRPCSLRAAKLQTSCATQPHALQQRSSASGLLQPGHLQPSSGLQRTLQCIRSRVGGWRLPLSLSAKPLSLPRALTTAAWRLTAFRMSCKEAAKFAAALEACSPISCYARLGRGAGVHCPADMVCQVGSSCCNV